MGLHRMTLTQLAFEVGVERLASRALSPAGGLAVEALAARTIHLTRSSDGLSYFAPVAATVGFARALARTISELRFDCIEEDALGEIGPSGTDLQNLLSVYEQELVRAKMADTPAVFGAATEAILETPHRLTTLPVILLDVLPRRAAEVSLLEALASKSPSVCAVALPQSPEGIRGLEAALDVASEHLNEDEVPTTLARLRSSVFAPEIAEPQGSDHSMVFFSSTDEGRECVEIARYILSACQDEQFRFDEVAVLLRNPETYQPLIEDALRRSGIPGYYTRGSVRPNPSGRAFLALLACGSEGLSASRFAEYLSLGQTPTPDEHGAPTRPEPAFVPSQGELFPEAPLPMAEPGADIDADVDPEASPVIAGSLRAPFQWERLLVDASVIGGRNRWKTRLAGLESEFRKQVAELGSEEENRREYIQKQLDRLGHLRRFALPVIEFLDDFPDSALWGRWLNLLEDLARQTLREPSHVLSILAELRPMSDVGPVAPDEVREVLTDRLTFLRSEPPDRHYGKVFVGTIQEGAGQSFELVFVPGVSEGTFPRKALEDPLLLDEFRQKLEAGLTLQQSRVMEERMLLHIAVGAARRRLFVSYPRMDVTEGRPRVPSFYALDIIRAAEGRIPELGGLEGRATVMSRSRLGWPSPRHASDAIDDTEYDLATIGHLLQQPAGQLVGRGRYLLGTNAHLARSLRTRWLRWNPKWSSADGIVEPDEATLEILASHRPRSRSYSPTSLQQFAACPYRFLLYSIHRLQPREEIVRIEQLDPLTRGSLFHEIQFRLLSHLRDEDQLPVTAANLDEVTRKADGVLNEVAEEYREELAPAIARIWESGIEDVRTDLRGWLRQRAQLAAEGEEWVGSLFEFSFGLARSEGRDPASRDEEAVILDGIRLRGSIDLVEEHPGNGMLRVIDHKTGRAPAQGPVTIGGGEVLQPTLYALAAENLLGRVVAVSELSYCTERGDYRRFEVALNEEARLNIERAIELIDRNLERGFLPAAPRERACDYCDYRIVCGPYEELRTGRKNKKALDTIDQLRGMP